jgi:Glycosyltransferase Family 4
VTSVAVALVHHGDEPCVDELAHALRGLGHRVAVVRPRALPEGFLRGRGFTGPLTHVPQATAALLRGRFDLVHAFSPPDALAARAWRRVTHKPVVVTTLEVLERAHLADRRLRLTLLRASVEDADAVLAAGDQARDALWRWMTVEAAVVDPRDGAAQARLYLDLLS